MQKVKMLFADEYQTGGTRKMHFVVFDPDALQFCVSVVERSSGDFSEKSLTFAEFLSQSTEIEVQKLRQSLKQALSE